MTSPLSGSQPSQPHVPALERDGIRYEQDVDRQRRSDGTRAGSLVARDAATGRPLWQSVVYANPFDANSPVGSPAIWFARMAFVDSANVVEIENTVGGRYEVDLLTHAVKHTGGPADGQPGVKPDNRPSFD